MHTHYQQQQDYSTGSTVIVPVPYGTGSTVPSRTLLNRPRGKSRCHKIHNTVEVCKLLNGSLFAFCYLRTVRPVRFFYDNVATVLLHKKKRKRHEL